MAEVLYPISYGTRMVTFDVLRNTFAPHMHPEAARRAFNFILSQVESLVLVAAIVRQAPSQPTSQVLLLQESLFTKDKSFHQGCTMWR
jgi:hypothetical protein